MGDTTAKICVRCGRDCSTVPRVKDPQGRYVCKACLPAGQTDIIPLAPVDTSGQHRAPCPNCGSDMAIGVPACPVCSYLPTLEPGSPKVRKPRPRRGKALLCRECGYDLTGLRDGTCPECGHVNSILGRRDWDDETSRQITREAYTKPIAFLVAGILITLGVYAANRHWAEMLGFVVSFPVILVVAYGLLWGCCITWLGFTSSNLLMLVQLAGIHATVGAVGAVLSLVPAIGSMSIIPLFLCGAVYVYLMSDWMDMESVDARIAAAVIYFGIMILFMAARSKGWV